MPSADFVIDVERLSKRYLIGHGASRADGSDSFREATLRALRSVGRRTLEMARGRQMIEGDAVEAFWALRDVSFQVRRGEVVGIIGRNGAGKSTLLKVLSRITEPTEGRVRIRGRVASLLEVGTGFHPELSGRENIFLNGAVLGMSRREIARKFDEIVAFAEVERFIDTPVKRYSSGMYVRLAFAVAAHLEPEILVVDEVLAVGDLEFQRKCLGRMEAVAGEGRTILFVSHNLQAIERLCTRALVLQEGRICCDGAVSEACDAYVSMIRASEHHESLEGRPREGSGPVRIRRVEVMNQIGQTVTRVAAGDAITVRLHYDTPDAVQNACFGFALLTASGTRVFNTLSGDGGGAIPILQGSGFVDLVIRGLTLAVGHYVCNVSVHDGTGECCDYVTGVPLLDVGDSQELPLQRRYDQSSGVVYVNARWSIATVSPWQPV